MRNYSIASALFLLWMQSVDDVYHHWRPGSIHLLQPSRYIPGLGASVFGKGESFLQSLQDTDVCVVLLFACCMLVYSLTHLLTEIWERRILLNIYSPSGSCEELGEILIAYIVMV